ncbi:MAG TPA: hypothetical protein VN577_00175 [Terriglobales bacterium]|nr:hypothetical protein [Terriglobales bacterium]
MWLKEKQFTIRLGGNTFIDTPTIIAYQNRPLINVFRQEDGYLAVDLDIHDSTGQRIASVRKNNLYGQDKDLYEVKGTADSFTLTDKDSGITILDIRKRLEAEAEIDISLRTYLPNGELLDLGPKGSNIRSNLFSGNIFKACKIGMNIG